MTIDERTPQQRAALATYHLVLRAFAGLPGMTTREVAALCGMCNEAARVMLCNLSASGGLPLYQNSHHWTLLMEERN